MLDYTQVIAYIIALGIAAAIPGPGMIALVARSLSTGAVTGFALLFGIILGDLLYLSFAVFGLALLAQSFNILFVMIKWGSILYLCYLAWQFWHAKAQQIRSSDKLDHKDMLAAGLSGLTITLGNPKTIAFYLALLPVVINLETITLQTWASALIPLTIAILFVVGTVFILGAVAVRRSLSGAHAQKVIHRSAATAMFLAAGSLVSKEL